MSENTPVYVAGLERGVYGYDFVDIFQPFYAVVRQGLFQCIVKMRVQYRIQRVVYQRRFTAAGYPGHTYQFSEREIDRNVFQVVAFRTAQAQYFP